MTPTLSPSARSPEIPESLDDAGRLSSTLGGMVNCPTLAFSAQKNAAPPAPGPLGTEIPRIATVAAGSTPDQLTVTPLATLHVADGEPIVEPGRAPLL